MDDHETKAPTVQELLQILYGIDFEIRNSVCPLLFAVERAQEKLDRAHPAYPFVAEAKSMVDGLRSVQAQLHFKLNEMGLPKGSQV